MPGLSGLDIAARISGEGLAVRVIILSMHTGDEYIARAIRAGAAGYILKNAEPVELELAIRAVMIGNTYLSPALSRRVFEHYARGVSPEAALEDQLTARQREILRLIAEGRSTKEIGAILKLSTKTVDTHRKKLMERLDIHDVAGLARYAVRKGIVEAE